MQGLETASVSKPDPVRRRLVAAGAAAAGLGAVGMGVNAAAPFLAPETPVFGVNRSYWSDALPTPNPPPARDLRADILVLGGGLTGLSAAYYARRARPDARVALLEAVRCGNGASGRNGAMLMTMTENTSFLPDVDPDLARRLYALTVDNIARIRRIATETGVGCDLETNGTLQVAFDRAAADAAPATAARLRAAGLPIEAWNAETVASAIGSRAYAAGLFDPGAGQVHPGKLVALWKRASEAAGVQIFEGAPVTDIEAGEIVRVRTAQGVAAEAPLAVLATNAYSSKIGYFRAAIAPIVNHVAITAPLTPAQISAAGVRRRLPFNDSRTNVVYVGVTPEGRLHIGGGVEAYEANNGLADPPDRARAEAFLRAELARIYPSLADVPFARSWWGFVDMTLDGAPAFGRMGRHENLLYAIGFSGQGVNLTSVLGRALGDLAADRDRLWSDLPYYGRTPPWLPNEPFRWAGVEAGIAALSR